MQTERWVRTKLGLTAVALGVVRGRQPARKVQAPREVPMVSPWSRNLTGRCYSQREIAKMLGVTHQRVGQIERNALRKVRAFLESKGTLP